MQKDEVNELFSEETETVLIVFVLSGQGGGRLEIS